MAAVDAQGQRRVVVGGGNDVVPVLRVGLAHIVEPPAGKVVFGGVVAAALRVQLFFFAQEAAQNRIGKRAELAATDFGNAFHRFVDHRMRRVARVVELVERGQKQAFELRVANRLF